MRGTSFGHMYAPGITGWVCLVGGNGGRISIAALDRSPSRHVSLRVVWREAYGVCPACWRYDRTVYDAGSPKAAKDRRSPRLEDQGPRSCSLTIAAVREVTASLA